MPRNNINLAILPVRPALDLKLSALHVQQVSVEGEAMGSEPAHRRPAYTLMEVCVQAHSTDLVSLYSPIVGAPGDTHTTNQQQKRAFWGKEMLPTPKAW